MEMRDRLIELINDCRSMDGYGMDLVEKQADHLLANGVIVPPCKVGDTVYYIDTCTTAEDYGKKYVTFSTVIRVSVDNEYVLLSDHTIAWWRGIFLTKEEAEKALKERESNG